MSHQGFLTRIANIDLPYPPMDTRLVLGIEEGIRVAWARLLNDPAKHSFMLNSDCDEIDITVDLELELDNVLLTNACASFTDLIFAAPTRGGEAVNFNGMKLETRPDLVFCLKDRRPGIEISKYDAVFAECKIVFNHSSRNVGYYVKSGLKRFLDGDYAWAMPHALMIGYVRTLQELPDPLCDFFLKKRTNGKINSEVFELQGKPALCKRSNARRLYRVCRTVHRRTWSYPPDGKRKPGDITVRHLWLEV